MPPNRFGVIKCGHCGIWMVQKCWNHKFCAECKKIAYNEYRKKWNKAHRPAKTDRSAMAICPGVCGKQFQVYTAGHGGVPKVQCTDCTKERKRQLHRDWAKSPAGEASRERTRRRARGEHVEDRRSRKS